MFRLGPWRDLFEKSRLRGVLFMFDKYRTREKLYERFGNSRAMFMPEFFLFCALLVFMLKSWHGISCCLFRFFQNKKKFGDQCYLGQDISKFGCQVSIG